jgi:hypothetical protein
MNFNDLKHKHAHSLPVWKHIEIGKQLVPTVPVLLSGFFKYRRSGEATSCTAFRDIYFISWSQKHSPLFCVLHQINPVKTIPFCLFKMQFYDILLSTLTVSCSISKIRYIVSVCPPLFISAAPNSHRSINYSVAEQRKRSGHMSLTHNAGPLQSTSGQSTAGGTVRHDSEHVTECQNTRGWLKFCIPPGET